MHDVGVKCADIDQNTDVGLTQAFAPKCLIGCIRSKIGGGPDVVSMAQIVARAGRMSMDTLL